VWRRRTRLVGRDLVQTPVVDHHHDLADSDHERCADHDDEASRQAQGDQAAGASHPAHDDGCPEAQGGH
jgi:hypothetical protein